MKTNQMKSVRLILEISKVKQRLAMISCLERNVCERKAHRSLRQTKKKTRKKKNK